MNNARWASQLQACPGSATSRVAAAMPKSIALKLVGSIYKVFFAVSSGDGNASTISCTTECTVSACAVTCCKFSDGTELCLALGVNQQCLWGGGSGNNFCFTIFFSSAKRCVLFFFLGPQALAVFLAKQVSIVFLCLPDIYMYMSHPLLLLHVCKLSGT